MFRIDIDTRNAAFEDDEAAELARILRHIADRIDNSFGVSPASDIVRDLNGNQVGRVYWHGDPVTVSYAGADPSTASALDPSTGTASALDPSTGTASALDPSTGTASALSAPPLGWDVAETSTEDQAAATDVERATQDAGSAAYGGNASAAGC